MGGDRSGGGAAVAASSGGHSAESLRILLDGIVGPNPADHAAFLQGQIADIQAQLVESESNPAEEGKEEVDAPAQETRRSGRKRSSSRRQKNVVAKKQSIGPPVDATRIDIESIKPVIKGKSSSTFLSHLDFINMPDDSIEYLFVDQYIRGRSKTLILPPRSHRRTAVQIKHWFGVMGNAEKSSVVSGQDEWEVVVEHNPLLEWNGVVKKWVEPEPTAKSDLKSAPEVMPREKCKGITQGHIKT